MKCQECGNDKAEYNTETISAALCPTCIDDRQQDPEPYDYPNESYYEEGRP